MEAAEAWEPVTWLTVGEPAPAVELSALDGARVLLASLWQEKPVALVLFRPVSSEFCIDHAVQLRDAVGYMQEAGGTFVAVCPGSVDNAAEFRDRWNLPYPVLCDPTGAAYGAYGVSVQNPGSFVIDTSGVLHFAHRSKDGLDNPSTWSLIGVVCAITGNVVEQPEPTPANGDSDDMENQFSAPLAGLTLPNYTCAKCGHHDAEVLDVSATSGMMSRMVNLQNRRFTAVSCMHCKFTEFYKTESGKLRNVLDLFVGG